MRLDWIDWIGGLLRGCLVEDCGGIGGARWGRELWYPVKILRFNFFSGSLDGLGWDKVAGVGSGPGLFRCFGPGPAGRW